MKHMILTIDVGNTNITVALYNEGELLHEFRAVTKKDRTCDELGLMLTNFITHNEVSGCIKDVMVCSVVPAVNDILKEACEKYLSIIPCFIGEEALKIPLKIKIDDWSCLGADRIATSVGAIKRYGNNLMIFDFGTATTCEVIGSDNEYLGGTISPGIETSMDGLRRATALLPQYKFQKPSKVVATSTNDALYGGIFYGTIGMIERIASEIEEELGCKFKVIATGGLSRFLKGHTKIIDVYDTDLTTFGLYQIYTHNLIGSYAF